MLMINCFPHAVPEQLASEYVDTGCVTIVFFDYMNSMVAALTFNSPSYMYAAVAHVILARHLHVNGVYLYCIVLCICTI